MYCENCGKEMKSDSPGCQHCNSRPIKKGKLQTLFIIFLTILFLIITSVSGYQYGKWYSQNKFTTFEEKIEQKN